MRRMLTLLFLPAAALTLGGCVAGLAASAIGAAARSARGTPASNAHLQPEARDACSARAAQHGAVRIIDVQQYSPSKIIVWGTVEDERQRQSFQCSFTTAIAGFKLQPLSR
ncbi:hypothetical protein ACFQPG_03045 [Sphingomonas sp. GCM10030256]|uniref:hypothetical protein n=1 Tax=Sphingomonas sp. GCM10030256 TaxID=3273427 RepID=UPI00361D6D5A